MLLGKTATALRHEILTDTSARFGQFRAILLATEGRADVKGLVIEISLLRAIPAGDDRILQNAGHNLMLTMAVLRNRLLLPGAGIIPEIIKGDEDALRLAKPTGCSSLRGTAVSPSRDGESPARRAPRFASPGKEGLYSQGRAHQYSPIFDPHGLTVTTPWSPMVPPPGTNIPQAMARNARLGLQQQQFGAAAASAATPHQLQEKLDQHGAEQATQMARPNAPPDLHVCFKCRTAD